MIQFFKNSLWRFKTSFKKSFQALTSRRKDTTAYEKPALEKKHLDKKLVAHLQNHRFPKLKQMKYILRVLNTKEKIALHILILLILLNTAFLGYRFYKENFVLMPARGGGYTEGVIGAPRYINPLLAQTNDVDMDLSRLIFSGLLKYNKQLELVPDLAESYTISEDQKTYIFTLRKNAYWHDGIQVTADDVVFTFLIAQDARLKSPLLFSLRGAEIKKRSPFEVEITLNEVYAPFLEVMTIGILPKHIWEGIPLENAHLTEFNIKPIGSGMWKFKSLTKDKLGNIKSYTLVPFENFYGQKPYLEQLTFKFYPKIEDAIDALNNRSVEGVSFVPQELQNQVKNPLVEFYSFYLPQYTAVFFNQEKNTHLKEKRLREALAMGVDKTKILTEALNLQGEIIHGPILPGFIGYNPDLQKIEYRPAKAVEYIQQIGWEKISPKEYENFLKTQKAKNEEESQADEQNSENQNETEQNETEKTFPPPESDQPFYWRKGDDILTITLTTADFPGNRATAELIRQFWKNIGIVVSLQYADETTIRQEIIRQRNYEALLYGEIIGSDPDPYPFWHSSQTQYPGLNLANFSNRRVDALLEEARQTTDVNERIAKYLEFQDIVVQEVPAIFLYSPIYTYAVHEKIQALDIDRVILPRDRFNNIEEWFIKTKRQWVGKP